MAFNKPVTNQAPSPQTDKGPIGASRPKTEQGQFSAPKPTPNATLNRQGSKALSGATIKPGSPNKGPKIPAGIVQKPFETDKHADKRMNKMFAKTGQSTLGKWSAKNDSDAGPVQTKINPAFNKTKEINQSLANRQKIMNQGFAPESYNKNRSKVNIDKNYDTNLMDGDEGYDFKQDLLHAPEHSEYDILSLQDSKPDEYNYDDINISDANEYKKRFTNTRNALRNDYISKGFSPEEADYVLDNYMGTNDIMLSDNFINSTLKYNEGQRNGAKKYTNNDIPNVVEDKPKQQNKSQNYYDSISKDLESGNFVNLDSGLLPYEYGFETNGNEDLAVDARKNKDGKYELYMYPETENGPATGYEPEDNEPTYTFDTFDDLKAFIENGYQESEDKQREQASKLFKVDLTDEQFFDLSNKLEKGEKDINDFIGSHPHEVEYEYDENGNETGGEDYIFLNPEDQKAYDKLISDVAKIYFQLVGDEGGEK